MSDERESLRRTVRRLPPVRAEHGTDDPGDGASTLDAPVRRRAGRKHRTDDPGDGARGSATAFKGGGR